VFAVVLPITNILGEKTVPLAIEFYSRGKTFGTTSYFFLGNMGNFGKFWEILGIFGKFWEHLGNFGNIWENLGTFEKIWEIWEQLLKILEKI
jgi:hypothetical protein